jgi:nitroreductase
LKLIGRLVIAMDTWQAINSIRVVRKFADRPLAAEHLERILHAGRRAGSSRNEQSWAFIVVQDRDRLRDLAGVGPYAGHLASAAAGIALVTPDPTRDRHGLSIMWDLGRASQNMVVAAWELGIGSVPATVFNDDLANRLLELPAGQHCEFLLSFGYPADPSVLTAPNRPGGRHPLADVVHAEHW